MTTAIDVIDEALERLGPNGEHWLRGCLWDNNSNSCLVGALCRSAYSFDLTEDSDAYADAFNTVADILKAEYGVSRIGIGRWNDNLSDFGPVRVVLEKARANLSA